MAQMVAHLIGNEEVTGSIPVVSSGKDFFSIDSAVRSESTS